ncbi:MAG: Do family serine endopeptidase [Actinobacteria bacterium]|nr:Do family serine endopeptidase [Actinomycetota bacterium]
MKKRNFSNRAWMYVFAGVLIGLIIAAGFRWTHKIQAEPTAMLTSNPAPAAQAPDLQGISVAQQLSNTFAAVAQEVNPSVVTIFTETDVKVQQQFSGTPFDQFFGKDFFGQFYQNPRPQGNLKQMGLGSGVIVSSNGIILTNNHVVKDADHIKVKLMDGREFKAKVKGTDPPTDLAVITIDAKGLTPLPFGNSDKARVGDMVLAIGSPLNPQLEHTVTSGIISAKGRSGVGLSKYEDYIQTDAAINPGNSGGALVNLKGELVGINSAIATQTGGFIGIGFAVPVNLAKKVMDDIIEKGKVVRGWLGVYIQSITPELAKAMKLKTAKGVIISKVQKDSPAEKAGLKEEDVILRLNGKEVHNSTELSTWISSIDPKTTITLEVLRDGKVQTVPVKLGELSPSVQQLASGKVTNSRIGLQVSNITNALAKKYSLPSGLSGIVVTGVKPNTIAADVGLQEGDVIMKVNRRTINNVDDFNKIMGKIKAGENLMFYLRRGEGNFFVAFTVPGK